MLNNKMEDVVYKKTTRTKIHFLYDSGNYRAIVCCVSAKGAIAEVVVHVLCESTKSTTTIETREDLTSPVFVNLLFAFINYFVISISNVSDSLVC